MKEDLSVQEALDKVKGTLSNKEKFHILDKYKKRYFKGISLLGKLTSKEFNKQFMKNLVQHWDITNKIIEKTPIDRDQTYTDYKIAERFVNLNKVILRLNDKLTINLIRKLLDKTNPEDWGSILFQVDQLIENFSPIEEVTNAKIGNIIFPIYEQFKLKRDKDRKDSGHSDDSKNSYIYLLQKIQAFGRMTDRRILRQNDNIKSLDGCMEFLSKLFKIIVENLDSKKYVVNQRGRLNYSNYHKTIYHIFYSCITDYRATSKVSIIGDLLNKNVSFEQMLKLVKNVNSEYIDSVLNYMNEELKEPLTGKENWNELIKRVIERKNKEIY